MYIYIYVYSNKDLNAGTLKSASEMNVTDWMIPDHDIFLYIMVNGWKFPKHPLSGIKGPKGPEGDIRPHGS